MGTSTSPVSNNLGNTVDTNSTNAAYGVPTTAGSGQIVGDSQNGAAQPPECTIVVSCAAAAGAINN